MFTIYQYCDLIDKRKNPWIIRYFALTRTCNHKQICDDYKIGWLKIKTSYFLKQWYQNDIDI